MTLLSVLGEAWRNLRAGTVGALVLAVATSALLGALAIVDVRAVADGAARAAAFRDAGAGVQTIDAYGAVDAAGCEALAAANDVVAAGAVREDLGGFTPSVLPGSQLPLFDVTPGLVDLLTGAPQGTHGGEGAWLPVPLARDLGVEAGDLLPSTRGTVTVAGTYDYPSDGRDRLLAYGVLTPVPATTEPFDTCWFSVWPARPVGDGWLAGALVGEPADARYGQLNTRLGTTIDLDALGAGRSTRHLPWLAAGVVALVAGLAVRRRRTEHASALHAGVRRSALALQTAVETLCWSVAGAVVALPVVLVVAQQAPDGAAWAATVAGLRVLAAGAAAAPLGALAALALTRERHLFRYFKER